MSFKGQTSPFKGKTFPERWKMGPDKIKRKVLRWYSLAKAQANFRKEKWQLTFDEYYGFWKWHTHKRGRTESSVALTRIDASKPWCKSNCIIAKRRDAITRKI